MREWLVKTANKSKQFSRVRTEWAVGSVEKKAPLFVSYGLFLIAGERGGSRGGG